MCENRKFATEQNCKYVLYFKHSIKNSLIWESFAVLVIVGPHLYSVSTPLAGPALKVGNIKSQAKTSPALVFSCPEQH